MSAASPSPPAVPEPASWQRYRLVPDRSRDVVYETDTDGIIQWISPSVHELLGWTPEQLQGQPGHHLVHPLDAERITAMRTAFTSEPRAVSDVAFLLRTATGGYRAVRMSAEPLRDPDGTVTGSRVTLADTHDRDAALRALATMSQANRSLVRATDEADLLDRMCRTLVETGRYPLAWYGRPVDDAAQSVAVVASAGEVSYLAQVTVSWGDNPYGHGPTGRCLRTGETQVQNRFRDDPDYRPWSDTATRHGFGGSISLPVRVHGAVDGALMVYADEPGAFDALAHDLLEDLAADLGYGMERLRDVERLRLTTEREAEQRARLQGIFDSSIDPLVLLEAVRDDAGDLVDLRYVEANAAACAYNRLPREQLIGARLLDLFPGQRAHGPLREYFRTIETGEPTVLDDYAYGHEVIAEERRYDIRAARCGDGLALTWRDVTDRHRAGQALADSERRYRLLAENSTDVILLSDARTHISWASAAAQSTLGWSPDALVGRLATEFIHPDDLPDLTAAVEQSTRTGEVVHPRYRWRRPDGSYRWMEAAGRPIPDDGTGRPGRVVTLRDVDEQVRATQALAESETHYRLLAENASDVIWQVAPDGVITWASQSMTRVLGWDRDQVVGRVALDLVHPDDQDRLVTTREVIFRGQSATGEFRVQRQDGSYRWMEVTINPVQTPEGVARVSALRDIDAEVAARRELDFAIGHDQVTGLPARARMLDRIAYVATQVPPRHLVAVLCAGVDSLGEVNEALSHAGGDIVLTAVAARVVAASGLPDLVGRGAGDEFIVVLPDLAAEDEAMALAERIRQAAQGSVTIGDNQVSPTVSIGIAVGDRRADADRLLREASVALRQAKESGRDRCAFADAEVAARSEQRIGLEARIRQALADRRIRPWFQPIVALADHSVVGFEALLRWPGADAIATEHILDIAQRSSLITDIDLAMVDPVVTALSALPEHQYVAVNVTGATLTRTAYAERVMDALRTHGVSPSRLHIEMTETMILTLNEDVVGQMRTLADHGCRWYVDDFGTGYSSISHLRDLPVSGLKLDKSFTDGVGKGDETSRQLAMALVGLANGLGLDTVAEGVETDAEAAYLRTIGWRHGQGWLYGKATPPPP